MLNLKWDCSKEELETILKISFRAHRMNKNYRREDASLDVNCCHSNGNPLRLKELLEADDFNFAHDVFGIARHLNRDTGKLENHFLPRFSQPQKAKKAKAKKAVRA